ncbi:MAG TPA: alpha/beta hydrolase, partial [Gammaproteobacteria bacterium]|nr:alpha/beta hydrolase [Gammaproteobacteria bacterium]
RYFDSNGVGRFIFEGISASDATCRINAENCYLSVMIYDNQQSEPLLERKLYLDLHDMKDFYQHVTAGPGGAGDLIGDFDAGPIQYDPFLTLHDRTQDIYSGLMPPRNLEKDYTFFVHGWRMLDSEKISFAETTFKRLYWSGYQGRFGALSWPTGWFDKPAYRYDDGPLFYGEFLAGNEQNYGRSEAVARQVGPILTRWIEQHKAENPGQNFHIVAHSMGNVVVSEALRAYTGGGNIVSSYTASESAEVAGAYDQREELLIRHTIRVVDSAPVFFDDCLDAQGEPLTNLGPEQSWRCYNVDFGGDYDMPPDMYRSNYSTTSTTPVAVQHGPTTETAMLAATSNTYYTGISSAANRIINFWNDEDEALRGWEFNQLTKPDFLGVGDWEYRNASRAQCTLTLGVSCPSPLMETSQFFITTGVTERELFWSNTVTPDSAQILSHIIPSRTQAMGQGRNAVASSAPELFGFTNSNQDHSGQFHGYYAERRNGQPFRASYWNRVLRLSLRLDPLSNDDLTGLKNDLVASE